MAIDGFRILSDALVSGGNLHVDGMKNRPRVRRTELSPSFKRQRKESIDIRGVGELMICRASLRHKDAEQNQLSIVSFRRRVNRNGLQLAGRNVEMGEKQLILDSSFNYWPSDNNHWHNGTGPPIRFPFWIIV